MSKYGKTYAITAHMLGTNVLLTGENTLYNLQYGFPHEGGKTAPFAGAYAMSSGLFHNWQNSDSAFVGSEIREDKGKGKLIGYLAYHMPAFIISSVKDFKAFFNEKNARTHQWLGKSYNNFHVGLKTAYATLAQPKSGFSRKNDAEEIPVKGMLEMPLINPASQKCYKRIADVVGVVGREVWSDMYVALFVKGEQQFAGWRKEGVSSASEVTVEQDVVVEIPTIQSPAKNEQSEKSENYEKLLDAYNAFSDDIDTFVLFVKSLDSVKDFAIFSLDMIKSNDMTKQFARDVANLLKA